MDNFTSFNLDQRLLRAISQLGWSKPTDIQQAVMPLFFEKKCLIVQAKTGSGKTAAYAIPLIQEILSLKQGKRVQTTSAIVIAPTKELCEQAYKNIHELAKNMQSAIKCVNISLAMNDDQIKALLADVPDIIIGTPVRLVNQLHTGKINLSNLQKLIIDEADLISTYGFKDDIQQFKTYLPKHSLQVVLLSATLDDTTKELRKSLVRTGAEWIRVELPDEPFLPSAEKLTQYIIRAEEEDKFVIILSLFQLKLLRGKTVIFVNSVDRCYKLKLFFEEFGIQAALLNSELPLASRSHVLHQFNNGMYDHLIATDETQFDGRKKAKDTEYGVVRGLDFKLVSNVINFDFPVHPQQYVHRVGRTARADQSGSALSFVRAIEEPLLLQVTQLLQQTNEEVSHNDVEKIFTPFQFKMSEVDGLRYRALDTKRKITKSMVREARLKEIKTEMLNSERLKAYFQDHQADYVAIRHDKNLNRNISEHLKHLPEYLVPEPLQQLMGYKKRPEISLAKVGLAVGKSKDNKKRPPGNMQNKQTNMKRRKQVAGKKKARDPLRKIAKK